MESDGSCSSRCKYAPAVRSECSEWVTMLHGQRPLQQQGSGPPPFTIAWHSLLHPECNSVHDTAHLLQSSVKTPTRLELGCRSHCTASS